MASKRQGSFGFEDLGFAKVDFSRGGRTSSPEVIFCENKKPEESAQIAKTLYSRNKEFLATRVDLKTFKAIKKYLPQTKYNPDGRIAFISNASKKNGKVLVITAGSSDISVAKEAIYTIEFFGWKTETLFDVGVAGIGRLLKNVEKLADADLIIVVAGMDGALPSVVGGLTYKPIIAVPTSVGYGASFKGLSSLLTMLTSCSPGITVVNIDNGFGAGVAANAILNLAKKEKLDTEKDTVLKIETNIDDMEPKLYDLLICETIKSGAVDSYLSPIRGKKDRVGIKFTALVPIKNKEDVLKAIFKYSTSIGLRIEKIDREKLKRIFEKVKTKYGEISLKQSLLNGQVMTLSPEYEECRKIASKNKVPIKKVMNEVVREWESLLVKQQ